MFVQVTAKNVGGVFFEAQCSIKYSIVLSSRYSDASVVAMDLGRIGYTHSN